MTKVGMYLAPMDLPAQKLEPSSSRPCLDYKSMGEEKENVDIIRRATEGQKPERPPLPQGYLEGFTGPDGFLEVFDITEKRWFRSKPDGVAAIRGYFDYSPGAKADETADQAFKEYEDKFPNLHRELLATKDWKIASRLSSSLHADAPRENTAFSQRYRPAARETATEQVWAR
jgi:hypothetical protein